MSESENVTVNLDWDLLLADLGKLSTIVGKKKGEVVVCKHILQSQQLFY
jgi:hypothetical protein